MSEPRLSIVPPRAPSAAAPTSVGRGAQGASPFASAWAAARRWRPQLSIEGLLIGLGLYFALACNTPFWRALLASRGGEGGALFYVLAIGVALSALNVLLLAPLLNRWTTKPLLGGLILVAAVSSYYAGHFGVYFDPSMLRNVLRTDLAEARELLTPGFFLQVAALALPPLFVLQRARLRRRPLKRALAIRAATIVLALVVAAASTASGHRDQETTLGTEAQFLDGASGKVIAQVVRKGTGKPLANEAQVMKADDVKSVIDGWASDLHQSYVKLKKH